MSTILKALRRLEDDRQAQAQRPLRDEVTGDPQPERAGGRPRRSWPRWVLVGSLALLLAVGAGVLAFRAVVRTGQVEVAERPAEPVAAEPAAGLAPPLVSPVAAPPLPEPIRRVAEAAEAETERELPPAALASEVSVVRRPNPTPRIEDEEAGAPSGELAPPGLPRRTLAGIPGRHKSKSVAVYGGPPSAALAGPTPSESTGVEHVPEGHPDRGPAPDPARSAQATPAVRLARAAAPEPAYSPPAPEAKSSPSEPARDPAPRAEAPADPPPPKPEVVASVPEPRPAATPAPKPAATPAPKPAAEPAPAPKPKAAPAIDVRVESTEWHPIAERRVAHVEVPGSGSREVREGDSLGSLVVAEISPSSVVFLREGVEVRRRVGE